MRNILHLVDECQLFVAIQLTLVAYLSALLSSMEKFLIKRNGLLGALLKYIERLEALLRNECVFYGRKSDSVQIESEILKYVVQ